MKSLTKIPILSIIFTVIAITYSIKYMRDSYAATDNDERYFIFFNKYYADFSSTKKLKTFLYSMLGIARFTDCTTWQLVSRVFVLIFGQFVALAIIEVYAGRVVWIMSLFMLLVFDMASAGASDIVWRHCHMVSYCCGSFVFVAAMMLSLFVLYYSARIPQNLWAVILLRLYQVFAVCYVIGVCISDMVDAIRIKNPYRFFFWHCLNAVYGICIGFLLYYGKIMKNWCLS